MTTKIFRNVLEALRERRPPWPRQIITLILPTVKMLSLGCERLPTPLKKKKKKKKRFWIITCTTIWVCYHYYGVFFAHLLILQYPDHHQNLISSSLYYSGPVHKISSQSVHNFLSNVVHRQTDKQTNRQTNQRYQKHNLLCQGHIYDQSTLRHAQTAQHLWREFLESLTTWSNEPTLISVCCQATGFIYSVTEAIDKF